MKFLTLLATALCALPAAVTAAPSAAPVGSPALEAVKVKARTPDEDWKTSVGWHGKVSKLEDAFVNLPRSVLEDGLEKRTNGGVYICQAFNWGSPCMYLVLGNNQCYTFSDAWRYTISAVGPDAGTHCILYWSQDCSSGSSYVINNPGGNLQGGNLNGNSNYWGLYNDYVGSIKCYY